MDGGGWDPLRLEDGSGEVAAPGRHERQLGPLKAGVEGEKGV